MRVTRIHAPASLAAGGLLELPAQQGRHLAKVLRLAEGAPVTLFNGEGGEFDAVIEAIRRDTVTVRVGAHHAIERESPLQITLLQGIARGEKMDFILQKATELGVAHIVPVSMTRSSVRLTADNALRKQEHWQAVVTSACEQCGRNRVPGVAAPVAFAAAVQAAPAGLKLMLSPDESARTPSSLLAGDSPRAAITLLVGPEGGFDADEIRIAGSAGFAGCRLGPRILRTETAALAALAALQAVDGDLS
ncbi:MAG TPA: 16S rRNA (uracil(1498)-N(3))-methyltransferase [Steroidobacteraceae bacterium]|nr:16S rRNA (uracil(1498)-N(3))-methyltransferase [Steroidobacteraceae bacterium]